MEEAVDNQHVDKIIVLLGAVHFNPKKILSP
jgi:hypothetical protein